MHAIIVFHVWPVCSVSRLIATVHKYDASYVSLVMSRSEISESSKSATLTVVRADRDVAAVKQNNRHILISMLIDTPVHT